MKNILIFKTDKLGDLINISPVISNLKNNYPKSEITLICSNYNYSVANLYSNELKILVYEKPILFFLLSNFKKLILKKYDLLLQLDGKNFSYFTSIFIRSKNKSCLKFIKKKNFLGFNYFTKRPNALYNFFFNHFEISYENYNIENNSKFHYLSLYLNLLKKLNIKIENKNHYLPFINFKKISKLKNDYVLFHIDKRWEDFSLEIINNLIKKILLISVKNKIVITSNIGGNKVYQKLFDNLFNNQSIEFIKSPNIYETLSLIFYSNTCISNHSGLIVHSAAAYKKNIIDIVQPDIFNELDRWVPFNINYKRFNINNFVESEFIFKS